MKTTLRNWQTLRKDHNTLILQASSIPPLSDQWMRDQWMPFPIGMGYKWGHYANNECQLGSHDQLVMCSIHPHTDRARRPHAPNRNSILTTLGKNGIKNRVLNHTEITQVSLDAAVYFTSLPTFKFVISPEGNGIDCHRHYEALIAGVIPVMERNPLAERKYEGLPIVWTSTYEEVTPAYLTSLYNTMLDMQYDFSPLFLAHYPEHTRDILASSKYWLTRLNVDKLPAYSSYLQYHS